MALKKLCVLSLIVQSFIFILHWNWKKKKKQPDKHIATWIYWPHSSFVFPLSDFPPEEQNLCLLHFQCGHFDCRNSDHVAFWRQIVWQTAKPTTYCLSEVFLHHTQMSDQVNVFIHPRFQSVLHHSENKWTFSDKPRGPFRQKEYCWPVARVEQFIQTQFF